MKELMKKLLALQTLEFGTSPGKEEQATIAGLRGKIPAPILSHYDRLRARGKKGIVAVQRQVCTGCHMNLPIGVIMTLKHGNDIQLCESCGRYLYLPEGYDLTMLPPVPEVKPKKAKRRPRAAAASAK